MGRVRYRGVKNEKREEIRRENKKLNTNKEDG